jgi:hypothetical protein
VTSVDPAAAYNGYGVAFNVTDGVNDFVAWCLDINHYLNLSSDYTINNTDPYQNQPGVVLTAGQITDLNSLFNTAYATLDLNVGAQVAGFQLALWEIAFEDVGNAYDIVAGDFLSVWNTTNAAVSNAAAYLANLGGTATGSYNLTFWEATPQQNGNHSQNLISASPGGGILPPVPLPAAGWMLGIGLLGLYGAKRRKKA